MPANNTGPNIEREKATLKLMIKLYCRKHHKTQTSLCEACSDLEKYALRRLSLCRYGENKTTCEKCPRHCYRPDYKGKIKIVMRYSGPRMIVYYPIHAIRHLIKGIKQ